MTDIAQIGFRVDTGDLEKGTAGLNKLAAAAAGVDAANVKMAKLSEAAGASAAAAAVAAARAENLRAQAALKALNANKNATNEEKKAAREIERRTAAVLADTKAEMARVNQLNKTAAALRAASALEIASTRPTNSVSGVISGGRVASAPIPRDMMPNRFNTANIAAQFQDIGVTAAMGMNPMTIALQQGTQLSAIINSMESPLKGIAQAFQSIFNTTSLLAIGFVGLVAALIQFTNWSKVGETVLNGLASVIEYLLPLILGLGAGLLVLNLGTVATGASALVTTMMSLGGALVVATKAAAGFAIAFALTPIGAITIAVTALVSGLAYLSGVFDEAGDAVRGWAKDLVQANNEVNNLSKSINEQTIDLYNQISAMKLHGKERIAFAKEQELINAAVRDYKGNDLAGYLKSIEPTIKSAAKGYANMRTELDALEEAERKLTRDKNKKEKKDPWEEMINSTNRKIAVLKAEQQSIGMSEEATAKLKYQTDLLNEAQQKGIVLDQEKLAEIDKLAAGMAATEAETKRLKDAYEFLTQQSQDFVSDLRSNLEEGKSIWESFASAVKNVIDDILNKIISSQIRSLIGELVPSGGAGGLVGGLADFLGGSVSAGAGIDSAIGASIANNPSIYAKGGAFQSGIQKFASGGIVSSATMFGIAGGKTGIMGEAGPEAIMPLHRGPDGSLGVKTSVAGNDNTATATQPNVTYVINAPGASKADLESVRQTLMALAGPGIVEQRVIASRVRGAQ